MCSAYYKHKEAIHNYSGIVQNKKTIKRSRLKTAPYLIKCSFHTIHQKVTYIIQTDIITVLFWCIDRFNDKLRTFIRHIIKGRHYKEGKICQKIFLKKKNNR